MDIWNKLYNEAKSKLNPRVISLQLDKDSPKMEILMDYESKSTITLEELIPDWWGKDEMNKA